MRFSDFSLNDHILHQVEQCGFTAPTPIQQQAILPIIAGRDLLGLAQTGTGKTAAFLLPVIQRLMEKKGQGTRALIIAPTRELADQINEFAVTMLRNTSLRSTAIYGGVGKPGQVARLRKGADIVVACPGRLLDLLNDRAVDLSRVEMLILDEADHMFDKGFLPDIRRILRQIPTKRQNLVFSATMPEAIRSLVENLLVDPVTVQISVSRSAETIAHRVVSVEQAQKTSLLVHLLNQEAMATTLVFTRTKHKAKSLAAALSRSGFQATSLQGNLSQQKRQQALEGFRTGEYSILVATDIAARGIDVSGISHVINYDMPDTVEAYIHRTGRTGRAERNGEALSFATREDGRMIRLIEQSIDDRFSRQSASDMELPQLPKPVATPLKPTTPARRDARPVRHKEKPQQQTDGRAPKSGGPATSSSRKRQNKRPPAASVFGLSQRSK